MLIDWLGIIQRDITIIWDVVDLQDLLFSYDIPRDIMKSHTTLIQIILFFIFTFVVLVENTLKLLAFIENKIVWLRSVECMMLLDGFVFFNYYGFTEIIPKGEILEFLLWKLATIIVVIIKCASAVGEFNSSVRFFVLPYELILDSSKLGYSLRRRPWSFRENTLLLPSDNRNWDLIVIVIVNIR